MNVMKYWDNATSHSFVEVSRKAVNPFRYSRSARGKSDYTSVWLIFTWSGFSLKRNFTLALHMSNTHLQTITPFKWIWRVIWQPIERNREKDWLHPCVWLISQRLCFQCCTFVVLRAFFVHQLCSHGHGHVRVVDFTCGCSVCAAQCAQDTVSILDPGLRLHLACCALWTAPGALQEESSLLQHSRRLSGWSEETSTQTLHPLHGRDAFVLGRGQGE